MVFSQKTDRKIFGTQWLLRSHRRSFKDLANGHSLFGLLAGL